MKRSYLVTGGSGFIGSSIVKRLLRDGHHVRVLDDDSRGRSSRLEGLAGDLECVSADIRDARAVAAAAKAMDAVLHLAFVNGTEYFYSRPELVLEVGVKGMMNVLDACLEHRIPELILASSSEVYQTPPSVPTDETAPLVVPDLWNPRYSYGAGKIISEVLAVNYGRKHFKRVVIFRPHNVYGPDMGEEHVIPQFVRRFQEAARLQPSGAVRFPIQGTGEETRAFVYIEDFTDGLARVIERGEHLGVYHIGTMTEVAIREVASEVAGYFGRAIEIVPQGRAEAKGGTARRCPDIKRLTALGYKPSWSLKDGVRKTADWYTTHTPPVMKERV